MRRSAFVLAAALLALCAVPPARAYTDAEISQFLTSSPWCHFRYSSAGGSTTTRRAMESSQVRAVERPAKRGSAPIARR